MWYCGVGISLGTRSMRKVKETNQFRRHTYRIILLFLIVLLSNRNVRTTPLLSSLLPRLTWLPVFPHTILKRRWSGGFYICHSKKVRGSNPRSAGHFGGRQQTALSQLVIIPYLMRSFVVSHHYNFQGCDCQSLPLPVLGCNDCWACPLHYTCFEIQKI